MPSTLQTELGTRFAALHKRSQLLVLPNAWDVTSARIFEEAGFPAIGTTSGGIANSLGYADGQKISRGEMLEVVQRIAESVHIPVTADMESGYGTAPEEIGDTAREVIAAGAVGMNLEDTSGDSPNSLADLNLQKERIRAIAEAAVDIGISFTLNARTDVFLHAIGAPEKRLAHTIERLNAYREAGAQCLFAPGVKDKDTIRNLVKGISGPLNILTMPGTPTVAELEQLGVARLSIGSGAMRATMGLLTRIARQIRDEGSFALMTEGAVSYADANRLVQR
jgi:2-methylisocitrate lyase-like PEP mutase family enzyme